MSVCTIQDYRYRTTTRTQRFEAVYEARGRVLISLVCNNTTVFSNIFEYDKLTQAKFTHQFILGEGLVNCTFSCGSSTLRFNYISAAKPAEAEGVPDIDDRLYFTSLSPPEITIHTLGLGVDLHATMLDYSIHLIILTINTNCDNLLVVVCSRMSCRTYTANSEANKVAFVVKYYVRTREHLSLDNYHPAINYKFVVSETLHKQLEKLAESTSDSVTKELIELYKRFVGFNPISLKRITSLRIYEVERRPDYILYRISGVGVYVHIFKPVNCSVNSVDLREDYSATLLERPDLI